MKTFYGIGIPVIVFFQLLNILGIINIIRFCRLKGFTISLFFIYFFSFTEQISLSLFILFIDKKTKYNYVQYAVYLYSKLLLGISYQISVFELKFIIEHYFLETPYHTYTKKRKTVKWIMNIWRIYLVLSLCFDLYFNYIRYFEKGMKREIEPVPAIISYASTTL